MALGSLSSFKKKQNKSVVVSSSAILRKLDTVFEISITTVTLSTQTAIYHSTVVVAVLCVSFIILTNLNDEGCLANFGLTIRQANEQPTS